MFADNLIEDSTALVVHPDMETSCRIISALSTLDFRVEVAEDSVDFIAKSMCQPYHLLIFELYMEYVDGMEILHKLSTFDLESKYLVTVSGDKGFATAIHAIADANGVSDIGTVELPLSEDRIRYALTRLLIGNHC